MFVIGIRIIFISILVSGISFCQRFSLPNSPVAKSGVLDLSSLNSETVNSENSFLVNLDGEWEFFWAEELPLFSEKNLPNTKYMPVPSQWQLHSYPPEGYATYRLFVKLPVWPEKVPLSISMSDASSAYKMFVNGKLVSQNGKFGKSKMESEIFMQHRNFSIESDVSELEILVNVSNFHEFRGGLWDTIQLGDTSTIQKNAKQKYALDIILFSTLFIMGLYHLGLFLYRRKDSAPFYFGLFCLFIALRTIIVKDRILLDVFPFLPFGVIHRLDYLSFYYGSFLCIQFIHSFFRQEFSSKWYLIFKIIFIPCILFSVFLPMSYYIKVTNVVQGNLLLASLYTIYVLIHSIYKKRREAILFFIGFVGMSLLVVNDILKGMGFLGTPYLSSYGLLFFILFQSVIFSRRFASSFVLAEKLGEELAEKSDRLEEVAIELAELTSNLERKIEERTKDLEEAKSELEALNHFTKGISSLSNLKEIFIEISKYAHSKYNLIACWLFLTNEKNEYLYAYKAYSYERITDDKYNYMMNKKIPLDESGGILYLTFHRKKTFYMNKIRKFAFEIDQEIINTLETNSFLCVPLISKNESVGILAFSNMSKDMKLQKRDISSISNLCSHIAGVIETTHLLQQIETAKKQTEELNQLIKDLNEELDLHVIMRKVLTYVKNNFGIHHYAIYGVEQGKRHIKLLDCDFPDSISETDREIIRNLLIPIQDIKGAHAFTFHAKRPFYLPKIKKSGVTQEELFVIEKFKAKSFLMIPLILQNEPVGILDFSNDDKLDLNKSDISRLSILGEHLAGIIYGSNLFKQVQSEKEKSLLAHKETELQKQETINLNLLIKSLNEELDLRVIMKKVSNYVKENFKIQHYGLYSVNRDEITFSLLDVSFPDYVSEEDRDTILSFKIPVKDIKGAHSFTFKSRKPFYVPTVQNQKILSKTTDKEMFVIEKFRIQSFLMVPLILQNKPIGILDFYNEEKMNISKSDISRISILGEQLAGIIYSSNLFKQVQEEKEKALIAQKEAVKERNKSEKLLLNILPEDVATELKEKGSTEPVLFESVSVLFTDFKGFTQIAEKLSASELVKELDSCFIQFDKITERNGMEKLKTIGDSYMCAGGIPKKNKTHAIDAILAGLEIQSFMTQMKEIKEITGDPYWELRLGIHSGPLVAGVIGEKKFAYDVWGDTVNTASRMESSSTPGKINISGTTYSLVKDFFEFEYRGKVNAKNKGEVDMYYVLGIRNEYSENSDKKTPNNKFWELYSKIV